MIGTENANKGSFLAETETEESLMLMGKVNALEAMVRFMPDAINADLVSAVLGFSDYEAEAIKKANKETEQYKKWFYEESNNNAVLSKENKALKEEIEELKKEKEEATNETV